MISPNQFATQSKSTAGTNTIAMLSMGPYVTDVRLQPQFSRARGCAVLGGTSSFAEFALTCEGLYSIPYPCWPFILPMRAANLGG